MSDIYNPSYENRLQYRQEMAQRAFNLFNELFLKGQLRRFINRLLGKNDNLVDLNELVARENGVTSQSYAGRRVVDIGQIRGTEGRSQDFDADFNPVRESSRDRWLRVAKAYLWGEALPPVELIQVDEVYYVRDGHHRISVAHSFGQQFIEAEIVMMQLKNKMM